MNVTDVVWLLFGASVVAQAVLLIRLYFNGLYRRYPRFLLYLSALLIESLALSIEQFATRRWHIWGASYRYTWIVSRSLVPFSQVAAVGEIFRLWARSHNGIGDFGARMVRWFAAVAVLVAAITLPVDFSGSGWKIAAQTVGIWNRGINCGMVAFLVCTLAFFRAYGGHVSSNLKRHTWIMLAFTTSAAAIYFLMAHHALVQTGTIILALVSLGSQMYWIVGMTRAGEKSPPVETARQSDEDTLRSIEAWIRDASALRRNFRGWRGPLKRAVGR